LQPQLGVSGDSVQNGVLFISGLPRSGSTLLAAILRKNPRFHAAMTSPVGVMYMALESAMSRRNETAVFFTDKQRRDVGVERLLTARRVHELLRRDPGRKTRH
jgi:hypothetical protein